MDAKFQPMRLLDLRIRDHVTISAGTLGFSTESERFVVWKKNQDYGPTCKILGKYVIEIFHTYYSQLEQPCKEAILVEK